MHGLSERPFDKRWRHPENVARLAQRGTVIVGILVKKAFRSCRPLGERVACARTVNGRRILNGPGRARAGWLLMTSGGYPGKWLLNYYPRQNERTTKWNPGFKLVTRISTGLDMKTQRVASRLQTGHLNERPLENEYTDAWHPGFKLLTLG